VYDQQVIEPTTGWTGHLEAWGDSISVAFDLDGDLPCVRPSRVSCNQEPWSLLYVLNRVELAKGIVLIRALNVLARHIGAIALKSRPDTTINNSTATVPVVYKLKVARRVVWLNPVIATRHD
jgi:hypothetical protein